MADISVIIPVFNEDKCIGGLLASLASMGGGEVLIVDGGSTDSTRRIVEEFIDALPSDSPRFRLLHNPDKLQAAALNIGLQEAANDLCLRLDGHLTIPSDANLNYEFGKIMDLLEGGDDFCAVGFKQRYMGKGVIDLAMALLSATPFVSGFSRYRYARTLVPTRHTAWLICVDRHLALRVGGFDPCTTPNEDMNFNRRLIQYTSLPIAIYPGLPLYYQPRSSLRGLMRQYLGYGRARFRSFCELYGEHVGGKLIWMGCVYLLCSLLYLAAIIISPIAYLVVIVCIVLANILFAALDARHFLRCGGLLRKKWPVLLSALLVSPLLAVVPSLSRSCGSILAFFEI